MGLALLVTMRVEVAQPGVPVGALGWVVGRVARMGAAGQLLVAARDPFIQPNTGRIGCYNL